MKIKRHFKMLALMSLFTISIVASADEISTGIPECDNYYKELMACFDEKLPADQRDNFKQQYQTAFNQWKEAAKNADQKAAIAQACTQAKDAAKPTFEALGC